MSQSFSSRTVGRGALWSVVNQSVTQVLVLVVFLVTARFVSKEAFGTMAVCLLVIEGFRQVAIESVGTALVARKEATQAIFDATFTVLLLAGVVGAAIVFVLAWPLADLLGNPELVPGLHGVCLILLGMGLSRAHEAWLTRQMAFKALALRSLLSITLGGALGITLAMHGFGLWSLLIQQLVTVSVGTLTLWLTTRWRPRLVWGGAELAEVIRHSRPVAVSFGTAYLGMQSDVFFASYYLGAAQTGVFNAAKRISVALWLMLSSSLNVVVLPIQALLRDNRERAAQAYLQCVRYGACFTMPLYLGVAVLAGDVVQVLLGPKWLEVGPVLGLLSLAGAVTALTQFNSNVLMVAGKSHWQTVITLINGAGNLLVFYFFAPQGLVVLSMAFLLKTIVFMPVSMLPTWRQLGVGFKAWLAQAWGPIVASGIMALGLEALHASMLGLPSWALLLVLIPAGALIFIAALFVIQRALLKEILTLAKGVARRGDVA